MQDSDTGTGKEDAGTAGAERNPRIAIVAAVAVAAALVVAVCAFAARPASEPGSGEASSPVSEAGLEDAGLRDVSVTVKVEGAGEVAVRPTYELTGAGGEVVQEGEITVNERTVFELEDGSYAFELLSAPVLKDGTTYKLPADPIAFEVGAGMDESGFEIELEAIAADDMTKEQLEAVASELEEAGASDAATTAREHATSAPSVSGSADSVKRDPAPSGGSSQGSSNPGASASGSAGGSSAPSTPSGGSGTSGSGTAAEPDPEPSQPAHEHSWVAQTEQRYVVDTAAWDEQIPYDTWKCLKCGFTCSSASEMSAHKKEMALSGDMSHNSTVITQYETVHHPEVGHWETVTTGYKCSGCGAWQ